MRWGKRIDRTCELRQVIASWKSRSFRAGARVTFLCVPKEKSPKERAAHRRARRCAPGSQASRGFSKGHPWPIEKRTTSCRAPCGPDPRGLPLRRAIEKRHFGNKESGFPTKTSVKHAMFAESTAGTQAAALSLRRIELTAKRLDSPRPEVASKQSYELPLQLPLTLTSTALRSGGSRGQGPQGARQEAARFSMAQGCAFEKPRETRVPGAKRRARRWAVLSFAYFSLHEQRKVWSRDSAKALLSGQS
mgnify:CR=1 FL=1